MLLALRGQAELLGSPGEERRVLRVCATSYPCHSLCLCPQKAAPSQIPSAMWRVTLSKQPDILTVARPELRFSEWGPRVGPQAGQEAYNPCRHRTTFCSVLSSETTGFNPSYPHFFMLALFQGQGGQVSVLGWGFPQPQTPCNSCPHCPPIYLALKSSL